MSMHSSEWFTRLASRLGHPGYITLTEVIEAEQEQPDAKALSLTVVLS